MRLIPLLLFTLPIAIAQTISIDVLTPLEREQDLFTASVIHRIMQTQEEKVTEGMMTPFESRCIATNTVDLLGTPNADRFTQITERSLLGIEPSLQDERFIAEISERYLIYLQLIANQCTIEQERLNHREEMEQSSTEESPSLPN